MGNTTGHIIPQSTLIKSNSQRISWDNQVTGKLSGNPSHGICGNPTPYHRASNKV